MGRVVKVGETTMIAVSVVILTYRRDEMLREVLERLYWALDGRRDIEVVLVDNNGDGVDRAPWLAAFAHTQCVSTGTNLGVSGRNNGMDVARGALLLLLDDDVLVETLGFVALFESVFAAEPEVGVVNVRKLDGLSGGVLPETIPHTDKRKAMDQPFLTFRFVGGLVGLRRAVHEGLEGFDRHLFYGEEEREYSYRILKAGWRIYYEPKIVAVETNHPGGRRSRSSLRTEILANRYIISYLHRPLPVMLYDFVVFTSFLYVLERGRISIPTAVRRFLAWRRSPGRAHRAPIGPREIAYIRACGGTIWR